MSNRVHFNTPYHAHELTFSCYKNRDFLINSRYCQFLLESIVASQKKHSFSLWAYVFMPTHVHLLIYPQSKVYDIAKITRSIKQPVSQRAIAFVRDADQNELDKFRTISTTRPFKFWQSGGGYDRNIVSREVVLKSINYIHSNPVKGGLVKQPEDWKWSSYSDWAKISTGPLVIDQTDIAHS